MFRFTRLASSLMLIAAVGILIGMTASPSHAEEKTAAKLVITMTVYADLPDVAKSGVTTKVAAMVKDDALKVEATNDNFGDPAEGVGKKLKVDYTFNGVAKSKTVDENETLTISNTGEYNFLIYDW